MGTSCSKTQEADVVTTENGMKADYSVVVSVTQGRNIKKMDRASESDAYVIVKVGDAVARSTHIPNSARPIWNFSKQFSLERAPGKVVVEVWDKNVLKDAQIGTAVIDAKDVDKSGAFVKWVPVYGDDGKESVGDIQVSINAFKVDQKALQDLAAYSWTHALEVHVVKGKGLKEMDFLSSNDSFATISFGRDSFRTTVESGNDPQWNQTVNFWVNADSPNLYEVKVQVFDQDGKKDEEVGTAYVDVRRVLAAEGKVVEGWYALRKGEKTDKDLALEAGGQENLGERNGTVKVCCRAVAKEVVVNDFFHQMLQQFDASKDGKLSEEELSAMLEVFELALTQEQFESYFALADRNKDGDMDQKEAVTFFRSLLFSSATNANKILTVALAGVQGLQNQMMSVSSKKEDVIQVMERTTGKIVAEKIPQYIKVAMKAMFSSGFSRKLSTSERAVRIMENMSVKRGRLYDLPESVKEIPDFVKLHGLNLKEVKKPLAEFKNFNEFFARELLEDARPLDGANDPTIAVSPADCRMMVFPTIADATKLWIKGDKFTVENVFGHNKAHLAEKYAGGSMVIARLAPQDYHRWHHAVDGTLGDRTPIKGALYTVNPIAINQNVNVYTANKREICEIESTHFGKVVAVAVGATMVGSITIFGQKDDKVKKGDQHGYFSFGGSTVLLFFEPGRIQFDNDLLANSENKLETLIKVNTSIGRAKK